MKTITIDKLATKETPKQILSEDFPKHNWPISGGWGYTEKDAVTIELDNSGEGIAFEQMFVEYRTYEELIIFRKQGEKFAGINIEKGMQFWMSIDGKKYDIVYYTVSAWPEGDYTMLKDDWDTHNGYDDDEAGREKHRALADSKKVTYETVCYFDISHFFGK